MSTPFVRRGMAAAVAASSLLEDVAEHGLALAQREQRGTRADETARGDQELDLVASGRRAAPCAVISPRRPEVLDDAPA